MACITVEKEPLLQERTQLGLHVQEGSNDKYAGTNQTGASASRKIKENKCKWTCRLQCQPSTIYDELSPLLYLISSAWEFFNLFSNKNQINKTTTQVVSITDRHIISIAWLLAVLMEVTEIILRYCFCVSVLTSIGLVLLLVLFRMNEEISET